MLYFLSALLSGLLVNYNKPKTIFVSGNQKVCSLPQQFITFCSLTKL